MQFGMFVQVENQSEVASIMQQIEAENESAKRAQSSFAYGTAQHKFITHRMERVGALHERVKELVGEEEAVKMLVQAVQ